MNLPSPATAPPLQQAIIEYLTDAGKGGARADLNNQQEAVRVMKVMMFVADGVDDPSSFTEQALFAIVTSREIRRKVVAWLEGLGARAVDTYLSSLRHGLNYLANHSSTYEHDNDATLAFTRAHKELTDQISSLSRKKRKFQAKAITDDILTGKHDEIAAAVTETRAKVVKAVERFIKSDAYERLTERIVNDQTTKGDLMFHSDLCRVVFLLNDAAVRGGDLVRLQYEHVRVALEEPGTTTISSNAFKTSNTYTFQSTKLSEVSEQLWQMYSAYVRPAILALAKPAVEPTEFFINGDAGPITTSNSAYRLNLFCVNILDSELGWKPPPEVGNITATLLRKLEASTAADLAAAGEMSHADVESLRAGRSHSGATSQKYYERFRASKGRIFQL